MQAQVFTTRQLSHAAPTLSPYYLGVAALSGLGDSLRALRQGRQLKLEEAARRAGLRLATLSDWENDRVRPQLGFLEKLLDALDADLYDLGAAIRESRGVPVPLPPAREPTPTSLGMAIEAMPANGDEETEKARRQWALLFDQEQEAKLRRYELVKRFVSART